MSDIVKRLDTVVGSPIAADAKREIESLRQQLAECQADLATERTYSNKRDAELAECQAREKVLRDRLIDKGINDWAKALLEAGEEYDRLRRKAEELNDE
jgi:hypothetical protein